MKIKVETTKDNKRKVVIDHESVTDKETAEKIKKSLKYSIKDGAWWSAMIGFGESYLGAFAVFLQATVFEISFLSSIPQLFSSLLQLSAVRLTNLFRSRRKIVLFSVFFQALVWPLIILFSYLTKSVWVLIFLTTLYFIFGQLAGPAWSSWMGDLVKEDERGRYFGRRNRTMGLITFLSVMIAGALLEYFSKIDTMLGFSILFSVSFVSRMISYYYLSLKFEPNVELRVPKEYGFLEFVKTIHKTNFGIFTLFSMLMQFAVYIAAPIFVVYWLEYFEFSYFQYMVVVAAAQIATFITISHWGINADYYGNKVVLYVSSYIVSIHPLFWYLIWFVDKSLFYPLSIILQVISGFAWAGFNLSSSNYIYDSVEAEDRIRLTSYHTALKGIAIFLGATFGGIIAGVSFQSPLITKLLPSGLFLTIILSFIARTIVTSMYISKIEEMKVIEHKRRFLYFITTMPVQGMIFDSIVGMNRTVKKFRERLKRVEKKLDYWEVDLKKKTKN